MIVVSCCHRPKVYPQELKPGCIHLKAPGTELGCPVDRTFAGVERTTASTTVSTLLHLLHYTYEQGECGL